MRIWVPLCAIVAASSCSGHGEMEPATDNAGVAACSAMDDECARHVCIWKAIVHSAPLLGCSTDDDCTTVRGPASACTCLSGAPAVGNECVVAVNAEALRSSEAWGLDFHACKSSSCDCAVQSVACVDSLCTARYECAARAVDGGAP